jgi:hypothetical protein
VKEGEEQEGRLTAGSHEADRGWELERNLGLLGQPVLMNGPSSERQRGVAWYRRKEIRVIRWTSSPELRPKQGVRCYILK